MSIDIIQGDCRAVLPTLACNSVHCVVTSPPFYGLRDYGCAQQIGLEATPQDYRAALVEVFAQVWRVLRDDGTLWLNLGDSFAGSWGNQGRKEGRGTQRRINRPMMQNLDAGYPARDHNSGAVPPGLKPKDLMMLPHRVAIALQEWGWWIRSTIVWSKPNPMPESVTDRPTQSHEYIFLLTKQASYFYDADAIREPCLPQRTAGHNSSCVNDKIPVTRKKHMKLAPLQGNHGTMGHDGNGLRYDRVYNNPAGRNKRSVWTIATEAYEQAHFATFPQKLVEPCILAGTSEAGCCAQCAAPWRRVADSYRTHNGERVEDLGGWRSADRAAPASAQGDGHWRYATVREQRGWEPACSCASDAPIPCRVLDPFAGSGTVGFVAKRLGRSATLIDVNPAYCDLAEQRLNSVPYTLFSAAASTEGAAR